VRALDSVQDVNQAIQSLLDGGEAERASSLLESALDQWPRNQKLLLTKGDVLARTSGRERAAEHYAELLGDERATIWAAARLRVLLEEGPLDRESARRVAHAVAVSNLHLKIKQPLLDLLLKRPEQPDEELRLLRDIAPRAGLFKFEWKLAAALTERGDLEGALDLLARAKSEGRTSALASMLLSELLAACGRLPEAIATLEDAIEAYPDQPDPWRRLIAMLQRERSFGRAGEAMLAALERWPGDWLLLFRLNRLPLAPEQFDRVFANLSSRGEQAAGKDDRYRFQFALACLHAGELERALSLLRRPCQEPVSTMMAPVLKALEARPPSVWRDLSRLEDDRTQDVQVARAEASRATVVVPTGIAFGYLPLPLVDALFAAHGVNVVYLRDFNKRAYLTGVVGLGEGEAATIESLSRLLREIGAERVIVMGASQGGFAALRYGALLGAAWAVSFSGLTDLSLHYEKVRPSVWNPNYFIKEQLRRERDLPTDLLPVLSTARATRFLQFHGDRSEDDVRQARRIEGIPGVTVTSVPGVADHYVLDHMIGDGAFDALLSRLVNEA